jgi:hypothetical protein
LLKIEFHEFLSVRKGQASRDARQQRDFDSRAGMQRTQHGDGFDGDECERGAGYLPAISIRGV